MNDVMQSDIEVKEILNLIPDAKHRLLRDDSGEYLQRLASSVRVRRSRSIDDVIHVSSAIQLEDGLSSARSDDTNGLKKAIVDFI